MKKYYAKILSILCLCTMLLSIVGCSKHTPKIYDFSDSGSGTYKVETDFNRPDDYVDEKASQTATVEFMGQQYTAEYKYSHYAPSNYFPWLMYESESVSFKIKETGELCGISFPMSVGNLPKEKHLPEEDYIKLATNVAMQYADVTDWQVLLSSTGYAADGTPHGYRVKFIKYIGEVRTSECMTLILDQEGSVRSFVSYMLGEFTEETVDGKFDYDEVKNQVIERMDALCSPKDGDCTVVHEVELILAKETKDKIVLLAEASRKRIHKEAEIYIAGDIVKFIIR